jgi:hypothetical protein
MAICVASGQGVLLVAEAISRKSVDVMESGGASRIHDPNPRTSPGHVTQGG